MRFPTSTGDECPTPTGIIQRLVSCSGHCAGSMNEAAVPSRCGPRHCGQSDASICAAMANNAVSTSVLMRSLSKCDRDDVLAIACIERGPGHRFDGAYRVGAEEDNLLFAINDHSFFRASRSGDVATTRVATIDERKPAARTAASRPSVGSTGKA